MHGGPLRRKRRALYPRRYAVRSATNKDRKIIDRKMGDIVRLKLLKARQLNCFVANHDLLCVVRHELPVVFVLPSTVVDREYVRCIVVWIVGKIPFVRFSIDVPFRRVAIAKTYPLSNIGKRKASQQRSRIERIS